MASNLEHFHATLIHCCSFVIDPDRPDQTRPDLGLVQVQAINCVLVPSLSQINLRFEETTPIKLPQSSLDSTQHSPHHINTARRLRFRRLSLSHRLLAAFSTLPLSHPHTQLVVHSVTSLLDSALSEYFDSSLVLKDLLETFFSLSPPWTRL